MSFDVLFYNTELAVCRHGINRKERVYFGLLLVKTSWQSNLTLMFYCATTQAIVDKRRYMLKNVKTRLNTDGKDLREQH